MLETAEQGRSIGRILPRMERLPNDRKTSGIGKPPGEQQVLDLSVRERGNEEEQTPQNPTDDASDRRHDQPGHNAARQHNERSNSPAVILRVTQAGNAREQDQRGDDCNEEQNMIEIDQEVSGLGAEEVGYWPVVCQESAVCPFRSAVE